jgi:hypothetical protein
MRLANMVAGARHEAREEDELLCELESAAGHDEEAAKEHWYHDEDEDIKCLLNAGEHESSTAQRTSHPGYSKLETRSFQNFDWRHETIVSPFPNELLYIYNAWPPPSPFSLHAGFPSATSTPLCVFSSYCSLSFISVVQKFSSHYLIPTFYHFRCQATFIHHFAILQIFQHNKPTILPTSFAGQLTTKLSAFEINPSTFNNSELQRTHCHYGCLWRWSASTDAARPSFRNSLYCCACCASTSSVRCTSTSTCSWYF